MINNVQRPALSRRKLLTGAAAGGAAVATSMILPSAAAYDETPTQVPGVPTVVDTSHASPEVARLFGSYFRDKSAADVEATMAHFAKSPCTYIDAILGWATYTWQSCTTCSPSTCRPGRPGRSPTRPGSSGMPPARWSSSPTPRGCSDRRRCARSALSTCSTARSCAGSTNGTAGISGSPISTR